MEKTQGLRHRQRSDQGPLQPESYQNQGFTDELEMENRATKKRAKSSKRKLEADYRLRNAPKSAWSDPRGSGDQVESDGVEDATGGPEECGGTVESGTSLSNWPYVPQETDDVGTLVVGLERNMERVVHSLDEVARTRDRARQMASAARVEVERRKKSLVEAIEDYSRRLNESVDVQLSLVEMESEEATERLKEMLASMRKTSEVRPQLTHRDSTALRDQLLKWLDVWKASKAPSKLFLPVDLSTTQNPVDYNILRGLFGVSMNDNSGGDVAHSEPSAVDVRVPSRNVDHRNHAANLKLKYSLGSQGTWTGLWSPNWRPRGDSSKSDSSKRQLPPTALRLQNKILDCPQLVLTFSCRLTKDKRTCGVTDVALTDEGRILVLDRNNKAVKLFDSQGVLLKYFGRNDLRKPSRISRIRSRGQIAVTDEAGNRVVVFSEDGQFQSQLIALQRPVSHCQLTATRLAIIEFSTRSVVICDLDGKIISTFPTNLECPSYIACTKSQNIIVTDWKAGSFKIFDSTGSERFSYCHSTSDESTRHVVEPYGVCADDDSVLIVADRKKREVVFYTEEGTEVWSYDDAVNQIGVPFAVDCDERGVLAIAEYTGTIRLFKYKTNEDDNHGISANVTSSSDGIYAAPVKEHAGIYEEAFPARVY